MNESNQHQPEHELDAPPKLVSALRDVSKQKIFVPTYVDSGVLKAAQRHLDKGAGRRRLKLRPWMLWPALAAICVLIACLVRVFDSTQVAYRPRYALEDLNHDGKVDILDSFALARELESGKRLPVTTYDVNGDGVVDEHDVVLIATHAVQLNKDNGS